jgi:2-polyprenyl-3-methyl-5-hydroxy-6-metoxy-1,4-benzoquinol methylase
METVDNCPICSNRSLEPYLSCIDNTVSHETFQLKKCKGCSFIITSPRPAPSELGKYYISEDYISHSSKAKSILDYIYKISRLFTLRWKLRIIRQNLPSIKSPSLLDYGCGTGDFLKTCKENGFTIRGVEPSPIARTQAQETTLENIAEDLSQVTRQFNVITLWHVLEHVPNLNETIASLKSHLEKNGTIFIAVPNHLSRDAKKYKNDWAAYDVPRHLWHFNRDTMKLLLANHALHIHKIIPMKLDAFYVSMLSEKHTTRKNSIFTLLKGFLMGMKSNLLAKNGDYSSLIYVIKNDAE